MSEDEAYRMEVLNAREAVVQAGLCNFAEAQSLDSETLFELAIRIVVERQGKSQADEWEVHE